MASLENWETPGALKNLPWPVRNQKVYPIPTSGNMWGWRPRIGESEEQMRERQVTADVQREIMARRAAAAPERGREIGPFNAPQTECQVWGQGGEEHEVTVSFTQFDELEDILDMAVFA